jgi:hypothetical protein
MSTGKEWRGGCMCGEVRYRFSRTASEPAMCHCESCRRSAGAPVVTWVTVPADTLLLEQGEPGVYRSSDRVERGFCPTCGTTLTYRHLDHADYVDIATATLDDAESLPPTDQIWTVDRLAYMENVDRIPAHLRTRRG